MPRIIRLLALFCVLAAVSSIALDFGAAYPVAPVANDGFVEAPLVGVIPAVNGYVALTLQHLPFPSSERRLVATPLNSDGIPDRGGARVLKTGNFSFASAATTPSGALIVWNDPTGTYSQPFSRDLSPLSEPHRIGNDRGALICNESKCILALPNNTLTVMDLSGVPIDDVGLTTGFTYGGALAAIDGGFAIASPELRSVQTLSTPGIDITFVDSEGHTVATAKISPNLVSGAQCVAIAPHPSGLLVIWTEASLVKAAILSREGQVLSSKTITTMSNIAAGATLGWNGSSYLLAISSLTGGGPVIEHPFDPSRLYGIQLSPSLDVSGEPFDISNLSVANFPPTISWNGSAYIVAWTHAPTLSSYGAARVARVRLPGEVDPPTGTPILLGEADQNPIALAASSDAYLAIWQESGPDGLGVLKAGRVDRSGHQLDRSPIVLAPGSISSVTTSSDGHDFAVVWRDAKGTTVMALIDATNGIVETRTMPFGPLRSDLVWDGSAYLVAAGYQDQFRLIRMAADGSILWSAPLPSAAPGSVGLAAVPGRAMLAWSEFNVELKQSRVLIAIFDDMGRELSRQVLALAGADAVVAASNGNDEFLLLTRVNGSAFATRISANGQLIDSQPGSLGTFVGTSITASLFAAPIRAEWLIFEASGSSTAIRFPSLATAESDGNRKYGVVADSHGRLAFLEMQVIDDVRRTVIRQASDEGAPPRRRATRP